MIVIADSGSTKTEWALVDGDRVQTVVTAGINPVHMSAAEIRDRLAREWTPPAEAVEAVWFYGAGCIPSKCGEVAEVLRGFFGTPRVSVESDLTGAARGLLGDRAGVAAILGTGSNSALYDGFELTHNVPPLGYILGDEGSGANLGRRFVGDLLKGLLPQDVAEAFYREYSLDYVEMIETVYRKPGANRFLAGFCPFLCRHIGHPAVRAIVEQAFVDFTERNLLQYKGVRDLPVAFTGSVAHYFAEPLRDVLGRYGLAATKIERSPIPGLIEFHRK